MEILHINSIYINMKLARYHTVEGYGEMQKLIFANDSNDFIDWEKGHSVTRSNLNKLHYLGVIISTSTSSNPSL